MVGHRALWLALSGPALNNQNRVPIRDRHRGAIGFRDYFVVNGHNQTHLHVIGKDPRGSTSSLEVSS